MKRARIELDFEPVWDAIDPAREFLLRFFTHMLLDPTLAGQISMTAHELLENAVKYSLSEHSKVRVEVDSSGPLVIVVENQTDPGNLPTLLAEVEAASQAVDVLEHYRLKMNEAMLRTDGKSCLGLARIRCEGQMQLRCEVRAGSPGEGASVVRMIATRAVEESEGDVGDDAK